MTTYTLGTTQCTALIRDQDEGWIFEISFRLLRNDGTGPVDIGGIVQRYGEATSNLEMRTNLLAQIKELAEVDYAGQQQATRDARAAAILAALSDWSLTRP
jgi:hypothetical protein